ncbi:plasmid replication protein [Peptacetobacter hominis]|uniref:Plasmid replication protein n=1 Tax=Peptacetobacter hominis TaxID=2743610 RepID=A0A544QXA5_9FIRM|nr:replication/maintenance protein RepL [Peptacetobacter hominis]TQQ85310.1 plasmid replication protein [Peptacetobacter hominis]
MFEINVESKVDINEQYTESRNIVGKKDKYSNLCLKNLIRVVGDSYTKKDIIPLLLIERMDRDNRIRMTLDEMSREFDYPKTGLSTLFTKLKKKDFLKRVKNGEYMINPAISYRGSRMDREDLIEEYHSIGK